MLCIELLQHPVHHLCLDTLAVLTVVQLVVSSEQVNQRLHYIILQVVRFCFLFEGSS